MIEVEVNHSTRLGPPRNQGRRPTCLVFATSDLNAFANATAHLSVEFLCHHAAKAEESWEPGDGFSIDQVFTAVASPGQPEEYIYPYRPDAQDAPLQAPPNGLMPLFRSPSYRRALALSEVIALVRQGRAVGVVIAVTKSLFYPRDGIVEFDPYVIPDQFHAMVAVGIGTHRQTDETHIYLRNSWGARWGNQGHAWVPERHLQLHMQEGFSV
ncbi:C1 family peptidase [Burkholderia dolosa]|uniref:C1 family peptidase n=1 Tax=Burkholderia dolosa TaxID=152500 RepID=UPI001B9BEED3|nr:C1 family peptidase [Burkholderia dolosa]MBR8312486.1 C1 family peptidase [Burkholderia dolosa]MBY4831009.1 C1 family peptidase [Burkholderia dolosa]